MRANKHNVAIFKELKKQVMGMKLGYLLTLSDVSEYLRVSESTVYRLLTTGAIPGVKIGRSWRVQKEALDDFLAKGHLPPVQE